MNLSADEMRYTLELAPVGIAHVSTTGQFLWVNERFAAIAGWDRAELETKTFQSITHPADLEPDEEHVLRVLSGELTEYHMQKRYIGSDGSIHWINLVVRGYSPKGHVQHFISIIEETPDFFDSILRILIVEDDLDVAKTLREGFHRQYDHFTNECFIATTCADAETALLKSRFNCVILDLNLPDSQGSNTFKRIKSAAVGTPIVIYTGNLNLEDHSNIRDAPGDKDVVILKPNSIFRALSEAVNNYVSRRYAAYG